MIKIGLLAGEASGDILGAGLIRALKKQFPDAQFSGMAGPKMQAEGCRALYTIDALSIMGFWEPLKKLPELIRMRKHLKDYFIREKIDLFIGIDVPDFNLGLEVQLKKAGIKTVHYASPSVWAWRQGRIKKIKKAVDLMLVLFPFEVDFYKQHHVPVEFVGHPLADTIPLDIDKNAIRTALNLPLNKKIMGLMPGSRSMELNYLTEPFLKTAKACLDKDPDLMFITSMVNEKKEIQFKQLMEKTGINIPLKIFTGQSQDVMAAADVLLLTSGTVTLEALLLQKPMVIAYRMHPLTYQLMKRLVKLKDYYSLPNLIAGEKIVPEFLQKDVTPEVMSPILLEYFEDQEKFKKTQERFYAIHKLLKQDASEKAALAIRGFNL